MGRKSNYPPCCIAWFILKIQAYKLMIHYKFKFKFLNEPAFKAVKRQHACCIYHFVKAMIIRPVYFRCGRCNWQQLGPWKGCRKCT